MSRTVRALIEKEDRSHRAKTLARNAQFESRVRAKELEDARQEVPVLKFFRVIMGGK